MKIDRKIEYNKIIKAFNKINKVIKRGKIGPIIVSPIDEKELRDYIDKQHKIKDNLRLILDE